MNETPKSIESIVTSNDGHASNHLRFDRSKSGWELKSPSINTISVEQIPLLKLFPVCIEEEKRVSSDTLKARAKDNDANRSQRDGELIFMNLHLFKCKAHRIIFPRDTWGDGKGGHQFFALECDEEDEDLIPVFIESGSNFTKDDYLLQLPK